VYLCDQAGGPVMRYTTRAVIEAELHVLRAAGGLAANTTTHGLDDRQRAAILSRSSYDGITREQALAFRGSRGRCLTAHDPALGRPMSRRRPARSGS